MTQETEQQLHTQKERHTYTHHTCRGKTRRLAVGMVGVAVAPVENVAWALSVKFMQNCVCCISRVCFVLIVTQVRLSFMH